MDELVLQKKSFEFALSMIRLYKKLEARQEFVLSSQLLNSGTQIGVSIEEAVAGPENGQIHLAAAARQARKTRYWLKLLQQSGLVDIDVTPELNQVDELLTLLTKWPH